MIDVLEVDDEEEPEDYLEYDWSTICRTVDHVLSRIPSTSLLETVAVDLYPLHRPCAESSGHGNYKGEKPWDLKSRKELNW